MELLFYAVACFGIIAVTVPLFGISNSLEQLVRVRVDNRRDDV